MVNRKQYQVLGGTKRNYHFNDGPVQRIYWTTSTNKFFVQWWLRVYYQGLNKAVSPIASAVSDLFSSVEIKKWQCTTEKWHSKIYLTNAFFPWSWYQQGAKCSFPTCEKDSNIYFNLPTFCHNLFRRNLDSCRFWVW